MRRLLLLSPGEVTRDPRARRAALTALGEGYAVAALSGSRPGEEPAALAHVEVIRVRYGRVSTALRPARRSPPRRGSALGRELRGLFRVARLAALNVRLSRAWRGGPVEVVHAHDFDTLAAGWLLSRKLGARLVYDAHELYAEQEPETPFVYRALVKALEGMLARRSEAVVTVSEPIADELRRSLRLSSRPAVVLNCPLRADVEPAPRGDGPLRAVYQGAMGPGRPLGDLLAASEEAEGVLLTIRVVNADLSELEREIAERGLEERVEIAKPVSPDELIEALAGFHVGLVVNRPVTRNDELVLPNKLFEYAMAGLAVVVPHLPGLAPLVEAERLGLTFEPGRPHALGEALTQLAEDSELLEELRRRARDAAVQRLNAEAQAPALMAAWGFDESRR